MWTTHKVKTSCAAPRATTAAGESCAQRSVGFDSPQPLFSMWTVENQSAVAAPTKTSEGILRLIGRSVAGASCAWTTGAARTLAIRIAAIVLVCFITTGSAAQDTPTPAKKTPELTDLQKSQIQNLLQARVIADLKAQLAKKDFDAANAALVMFAQSLQVDGYTLNLQTLSYDPAKEPTSK